MKTIGILALQGAFAAHASVVERLGHRAWLVRAQRDFEGLDALVLPGGESTVQLHMLERLDLERHLCAAIARGVPVLATCAGVVLLARKVSSPLQRSFGFADIEVERNAWGRQVESFESTSDGGFPLVFIRAPRIVSVGPRVEVLDAFGGEPILVRDRNVTCATFHPELTDDASVHAAALHVPRRASVRRVSKRAAASPAT